ncbi:MAG: TIGR03619 family F420-dependent LLM class oxidoreductase [Streptosporangiales bacterium]|nr:TIGR03619 family F420-dependent LLM class oxidoreductase [Streptosporangiales bacterium]
MTELGVHLPISGAHASPEAILRAAETAERIGLGAVWVYERLLRPVEPIPMGGFGPPVDSPADWATVYEALEVLSYLAGRTERIALGTSVIPGLLQDPVHLARRLATIDRLSNGRLIAGIGQGWMSHEFVASGVPMTRRGAGFEEHLQAMHAVWGPDPVRFDGRFYQIPECEIGPKPVRAGSPTLVLGAGAPAALERAARLGAGLATVVFDWDMLKQSVGVFRTAAAAAGHDPDTLPLVVQVNGTVGDTPVDDRMPLTGSIEQVATDLEELDALRVDHVLWFMETPPDEQMDVLERLLAVRGTA